MLSHILMTCTCTSMYNVIQDFNTSTRSAGAVEKYHNCVDDPTLFNLRMLNKILNIIKGAVMKRWLHDRVRRSGAHLQGAEHKCPSVKIGVIDTYEANKLATILAKDLVTKMRSKSEDIQFVLNSITFLPVRCSSTWQFP